MSLSLSPCLQVFDGNSDTNTAVLTRFEPPIFASELRVVPFSKHPRTVCLRFELHGCKDKSE